MMERILAQTIRTGRLVVRYPDGRVGCYGEGQPEVEWALHDPAAIRRLLRNPWLEFGQTYMEGAWDAPQGLAPLIELLLRNFPESPARGLWSVLKRRIGQWNSLRQSRRHVARHYDLDEQLFRMFLDSDLHYSCAYFATPDTDLEAAQQAKCQLLLRKLGLTPGQRVLDIGSGWGGLALYLAQQADVEVTGLTLSKEQHRVATRRAAERGLSGQVRFEIEDYRRHRGLYDRVVSVGMFEHVGAPHYRTFFDRVQARLAPGGLAVLHHIGRSGVPGETNPWIRKYIFPGGYNPSLSEVLPPLERAGLLLADVEVLKFHYRYTLREWQRRFQAHRTEALRRWGEPFVRMWEFYLAACEASFATGELVVFQLQMARSLEGLPMTRGHWYAEDAPAAPAAARFG